MASKHISLPSTFAAGDSTEWFKRFEICCIAQGKGRKNTGNSSSRVKYTIRDTDGTSYLTGKLRNRVLQCTCSHGVRVRVRTYEEELQLRSRSACFRV